MHGVVTQASHGAKSPEGDIEPRVATKQLLCCRQQFYTCRKKVRESEQAVGGMNFLARGPKSA